MDTIWKYLENKSPFKAQTSRGKSFTLYPEDQRIKIKIEGREKPKYISRERFDQWCVKWFENGEKKSTQYRNNTGKSNASNFAYISRFFSWYEENNSGLDLDTLTANKVLEEARSKVLREITERRGQSSFRDQLLEAYNGKCAVTGCEDSEVLEAAHIVSYKGPESQHVQNGLLLRSDIHLLFDSGSLRINDGYRVEISKSLKSKEYSQLSGTKIRVPENSNHRPNKQLLNLKYNAMC